MRKWLVMARRAKDLTQLNVAARAGITRAYYAQIELNIRNPSIRVAKNIASILDFSWIRFFEDP
jgi:putative transcriptional regulator